MKRIVASALLLILALSVPSSADVLSKAAGEATEFVLKKFGKAAMKEGAENFAGRLATMASRHGDDVLLAVRKVGPKALGLVDDAAENAPRVLKLLTRYGDDAAHVLGSKQGMALFTRFGDEAAEIMMKHKGVAEPLMQNLGGDAIKALKAVGARNGRRLAMMAEDGANATAMPKLLGAVAAHGDDAMEFIWRHKATLAGGAALTAFLANPKPYLEGTATLVESVAEGGGQVVHAVSEGVIKPAASATIWVVGFILLTLAASVYGLSRSGALARVIDVAGPALGGIVKASFKK